MQEKILGKYELVTQKQIIEEFKINQRTFKKVIANPRVKGIQKFTERKYLINWEEFINSLSKANKESE